MTAKKISKILATGGPDGLGRLVEKSGEIGRLTVALADALPDDLGAAIVSASVDDAGVLQLKARSSAWASRLRFEEERLLEAAASVGRPAKGVRVRVGRPDQA